MYVIPVERLEISGLCNLSLHWYKSSTMHFNNHFTLLGTHPKVSRTLRQGRKGLAWFSAHTYLTNHLNGSYSCHRLGEQEHTQTVCPYGDFASHKVQEQLSWGWHQPTGTREHFPGTGCEHGHCFLHSSDWKAMVVWEQIAKGRSLFNN